MNCLMFQAVIDMYIYMYICKSQYKCLWSKEINIQDFPLLPPITHYEYQFCVHDMYFSLSNMFQYREFQLPLMKSLFR